MGNDKRVRRMKSVLLIGPYFVVLVPIVLCIALFCIISNQNRQIEELNNNLENLIDNQEEILDRTATTGSEVYGIEKALTELGDEVEIIRSAHEIERDPNAWPKKVYLTFDDGPSPNTEKILDILNEYNVKGNFFVVGTKSDNLKKMYKRIVDEGHVIGMHSFSHKYSEIYASKDAFVNDLDKIAGLIYDEAGVWPTLYRFPGGSSNYVSKVPMSELIDILNSRGITYYDWNVSSGDATNPIPPTEDIIKNSLNRLDEYEEVMILFHDLANKTTTVEALPKIIEALLDQGITIAPIDDTTMLIQHTNK